MKTPLKYALTGKIRQNIRNVH